MIVRGLAGLVSACLLVTCAGSRKMDTASYAAHSVPDASSTTVGTTTHGTTATTTRGPVRTTESTLSTTTVAHKPGTTTSTSIAAATTSQVVTTTTLVGSTTVPSTTTLPATTLPATTLPATTLPATGDSVTHRQYPMYDRSGDVTQLQMILGLSSVDGIYGPVTRAEHVAYLGGPHAALAVFHPEIDYPVPTSDTTLGDLINRYFLPDDRAWARQVAFCESSAQTYDTESAVVSSALAVGWFQHLAKFWSERSEKAGVSGVSPFDTEANVAVAAWLLYEGGGERHWNPSRTCWEEE